MGYHERLDEKNGHYFSELEWWRNKYMKLDIEMLELEFSKNILKNQNVEDAEIFLSNLKNKNEITLLCLAPLTNISHAILKDNSFLKDFDKIVIMGGTIEKEGNTNNKVSEWNFYADPKAAEIVISSLKNRDNKNTFIFGLDVAHENVITREQQMTLIQNSNASVLDQFGLPIFTEMKNSLTKNIKDILQSLILRSPYAVTFDPVVASFFFKKIDFEFKELQLYIELKNPYEGKVIYEKMNSENNSLQVAMKMNEKQYLDFVKEFFRL